MVLGPLEYLIVGFEGNRFTGQILAELRAAQEKGIIRVLDLFVMKKDVHATSRYCRSSSSHAHTAQTWPRYLLIVVR